MKELGCYTDGQRQVIVAADTRACPTCAGLNDKTQKIDRECRSKEELGCPPWSQKRLMRSGLNSNSACLTLKPGRADLTFPDPQQNFSLSYLERQGFVKPYAINTWQQKLDTELRKITLDTQATHPQVDIKPSFCCEFWMHDVDLAKHKAKHYPNHRSLYSESHDPAPPPLSSQKSTNHAWPAVTTYKMNVLG
eukprot:1142676-Pelagomonas_calceolata.AAC.2